MRKRCSKCGKDRRLRFFDTDPRYRLGVKGWCKDCVRNANSTPVARKRQHKHWEEYVSNPENKEYERVRASKKYHRDPRHVKDLVLKNKHGISLKKFERTKRCLLCKRPVRLVADHNHKTSRYRGALCIMCNLMIAWIERFPNMLRKIKKYLRRE